MTARDERALVRKMRRGEAVFFNYRGYLCCSPILRVNRTTITVVTSNGERRIPFAKVQHD